MPLSSSSWFWPSNKAGAKEVTPAQVPMRDIHWNDIVSESDLRDVSLATGVSRRSLRSALRKTADELETVHPDMRGAVALGIRDLYVEQHLPVMITDGYRHPERQIELVRQHSSRAGPGMSFHNHSLAVDVVPIDRNGRPTWDVEDTTWRRIGAVLDNQYGTHSIGDWDRPHHQIFDGINNALCLPERRDGHSDLSSVRHLIPEQLLGASRRWESAFRARHNALPKTSAHGRDADSDDDRPERETERASSRAMLRNACAVARRAAPKPTPKNQDRFDVADVVKEGLGQLSSAATSVTSAIGNFFRG